MNFRQAEDYLLGLELFGMRFGLDRMHRLMTVLDLPQRRYGHVHVVGSNGKSSTARFCAAILRRHGLRTGSYTSPHLGSFRERVEVGEKPLTEAEFAAAVSAAADAAELVNRRREPDDGVTQFEALTAAAFVALARGGVEAAVIEAGLGGRYDATNVIPSKVSVVTSVGLEHTRWLGPTVAAIAEEKLAVLQPGSTLVVAPALHPDARAVAEHAAERAGSRLVVARGDLGVRLRAPGGFQRANFALAAAAAEAFLGEPVEHGVLERAAADTRIPGRLDVISDDPLTVLDGAHNPEGAEALAASLTDVLAERRPRVAVIGVLDDKDAAGMLATLLPHFDSAVFTRPGNPRALPPATLATLEEKVGGPPAEIVPEPRAALARARELAGTGGAVVATGSIYLIADLVRADPRARVSTL
ncbi:MAG TPA: cyanophycin synthetase [Thermoleophilaceae bacterium]|nr:cyanophycin synthetase [Thermoleophilaceae bacterium]